MSSGAFGTVYGVVGEDNNKYALKELKNFNMTNKGRFEREIKIISQLNHPNIVKIFYWNVGGDGPPHSADRHMQSSQADYSG